MFRVSSIAFGLSATSLFISSRLYKKVKDELNLNLFLIEKAINIKPSCYGCIYSSGDALQRWAIHPIEQRDDCTDRVLR